MPTPSENPRDSVRRRLFYYGRVQGVGFRYTACEIARQFPVTGYVRNLTDGRVELVAEAAPVVLDRFQEAVAEAMRGHIRGVEATELPANGEFTSFSVSR